MPDHTIVILLGIVFSCVNPLLCVAACLYFCVVWLLNKYDMLYVWQETYQAGGKVNASAAAVILKVAVNFVIKYSFAEWMDQYYTFPPHVPHSLMSMAGSLASVFHGLLLSRHMIYSRYVMLR